MGISIIAITVALPAAFGLELVTNTQEQEQVVEATPTPQAVLPASPTTHLHQPSRSAAALRATQLAHPAQSLLH